MSMDRDAQLVLSLPADPGATFDTFATPPNETAVHHLLELAARARRADTPRQVVLWGPPGVGKTHLLQAFCHAAAEHGARVAMVPLDDLLELGPGILEGLGTLDAVCLDDVDAVAGREAWELGLFTLINSARGQGATLVLSATQSPRALPLRLPDLASRLLWGAVFGLAPLDDAGRSRALRAHADTRGFRIPDEVIAYLMRHGPRDMRALMEILGALDRRSLVHKRRVTVPLAREVLGRPPAPPRP
jgi:DnaA family protein